MAQGYKTAARIKALGYTQGDFLKIFNERYGLKLTLQGFNDCIHDRKSQSGTRRSMVQARVLRLLDEMEGEI